MFNGRAAAANGARLQSIYVVSWKIVICLSHYQIGCILRRRNEYYLMYVVRQHLSAIELSRRRGNSM